MCVYVSVINTRGFVNSDQFHGLLITVWGPKAISMVVKHQGAYRSVINNRSLGRFWPVSLTITQIRGPGVISTIDEPRGAFMCRLSTLTILADSGPFRALLLYVFGSGSDFHGWRSLKCIYVSIVNTHSFGQF